MGLFLYLIMSTEVHSIDCLKHPVFCHIKRVAPHLSPKKSLELSNLISKYAKKYDQDPHISVAIAAQESSFRFTNRKSKVVLFSKNGYEIVEGGTDLCMFQIHINTALNEGLSILKLHKNIEYCIESHFKILVKKRKACKKLEPEAWSCYHSFTPSFRKEYIKKVRQYL
jgi:hypothetical protein